MNSSRNTIIGSIVVIAVLVALLAWNSAPRRNKGSSSESLLLYCAAGLKLAVEPAVRDYEEATGSRVQVQYAGSGTLLSNLKVAKIGDLYLAADRSFLDIAIRDNLVAETIPLAKMVPVIAVAKGNPKGLKTLNDLARPDVRLVLPNSDAAAIGKVARAELDPRGQWEPLSEAARAFKPTVNELANDLKLGSADAVILWDATAKQYPEIEVLPGEFFGDAASEVGIGVLSSCEQPQAALQFARFLGAPDRGLKHFVPAGFTPVEGDKWADTPELVFYSGGVNRVAIEETLRKFEAREGVNITTVYNGCGILTSQIRAGQQPDGYFACDVSFMETVASGFGPAFELSETTMVIATTQGNPKKLNDLKSLSEPGLKLGVANEKQSALGSLTARLLRNQRLFDPVMDNVVVQTPTADLLVNQLRSGALDAVIVYEANTIAAADKIAVVKIDLPGAIATQPIAIRRGTEFPRLMERLIDSLRTDESKDRFTSNGFRWREGLKP